MYSSPTPGRLTSAPPSLSATSGPTPATSTAVNPPRSAPGHHSAKSRNTHHRKRRPTHQDPHQDTARRNHGTPTTTNGGQPTKIGAKTPHGEIMERPPPRTVANPPRSAPGHHPARSWNAYHPERWPTHHGPPASGCAHTDLGTRQRPAVVAAPRLLPRMAIVLRFAVASGPGARMPGITASGCPQILEDGGRGRRSSTHNLPRSRAGDGGKGTKAANRLATGGPTHHRRRTPLEITCILECFAARQIWRILHATP